MMQESINNGIGSNILMRQNNILYEAEISLQIKLSPCVIHPVSITRALNEAADLVRDQRMDPGLKTALYVEELSWITWQSMQSLCGWCS